MTMKPILRIATSLILVAVAGAMHCMSPACAAEFTDRIRTSGGAEAGEITGTTPLEISLDKGTAGTIKIPVNQLRSVLLDDEPPELTQARLNAKNGGYATALERLEQLDASKVQRDLVREDVEFYLAYCAAQQALGGNGEVTDAGRKLNEFVRRHPQNFHYLEAVETMGDLLMASDKFAAAQKQYAELAKAPWPDYKMRAGVLLGRTLQAQGKHPDAIQEFDTVLAAADNGTAAKEQKLSAALGKAVSLAESELLDQAVQLIEQMIQDTDPEQKELQARAYNALGVSYERAGRTKDALLAFLHVDVLYSTVPEAHAEALSHLATLWDAAGQSARAREAKQTLNERYGRSRFAR
jgi:tetratricopeptide (TPR) repeat protein